MNALLDTISALDAKDVFTALMKQGVIIRPMGGKRLRVTIGLPEENKRFVAELEKIVKQ
jgi:histidinol-phosphate aminotransferase